MSNPYESPSAADGNATTAPRRGGFEQTPVGQSPLAARVVRWFALVTWFYPAILVAGFYFTWLMAWMDLGHMPRPSLDDPKQISAAVDVVYVFAGLLLVGFPAAAVAGVMMQLSIAQRSWVRRFVWVAVLVLIWILTIAFLRWDPLLVGEWYMD